MSWWKSKPPAPKIPPYQPAEPKVEPRPEPMVVEENLDPSESMILRVRDAIVRRLKGD